VEGGLEGERVEGGRERARETAHLREGEREGAERERDGCI
jgi:hypothetical protein